MRKPTFASALAVGLPLVCVSLVALTRAPAAPPTDKPVDKPANSPATAPGAAPVSPPDDATAPVSPNSPTVSGAPAITSTLLPALREANIDLLAGKTEEGAALLKSLDPRTLDEKNAKLWRLLSQTVAVRHGDADALKRLSEGPAVVPTADVLTVTAASWTMKSGELDRTEALLKSVRAPEALSEIPRREYLALWARLAQLQHDPKRETAYVTRLVNFASNWPDASCQTCHANPKKYGTAVTTLDVSDWWVGDRYVALLTQSGQASAVRGAAEKELAKDPTDDAARLRLAYAQRALGDKAGADKTLHAIAWAQFPDREQRDPLRLRVFP